MLCERSNDISRERTVSKYRISAPAMNVVPAPMRTTARAAGSAAARMMAASIPSGTPGLSALTGGLSTVTTATSFWISYRMRSDMAHHYRNSAPLNAVEMVVRAQEDLVVYGNGTGKRVAVQFAYTQDFE